jgi:low temperature requirement protein LtrA
LLLPDGLAEISFLVLAVKELLIPMWAERAGDHAVFHPEHIEERYGLFTIIVLGESMISAVAGFQLEVEAAGLSAGLLTVGLSGLVMAFSAWWIYFDHPGHLTPTVENSFRWGYAHVVLFAALAALGAGVHVASEAVNGHAEDRVGAMAVAVPGALYLLGLAVVMRLTGFRFTDGRVTPKLAGAVVVLGLGAFAPVTLAVAGCAGVFVVLAATMVMTDPPAVADAKTG